MKLWFDILRRRKLVRASALAIFLYGFAGAATSPYQSLIGIRELGLSDSEYAAVALFAAIANVALSMAIGILSDRFRNYRSPLIVVAAAGVLGYGMIWLWPNPISFVLAMVGPLALFHATNSLLFGNVRAYSSDLTADESRIVNALMRMMISLSWVLVPGAVGLAMQGRESMIGSFLIAALLAACCLTVIWTMLEPDRPTHAPEKVAIGGTGTSTLAPSAGRPDRPAQVRLPGNIVSRFGEVLSGPILLRILGVALISQVLHVNAAVLPLIVTGPAGGDASQIGMIVGLVAALEVVFMVMWSAALRVIPLPKALAISAAAYLVYLVILALAGAMWQVWLGSIIAGFAAAGIISLPISYLLDLIRDRPGLSASLIAVNMFAGGALGAGIFATGAAIGGYGLAALGSGIAGIIGALLLLKLERGAGVAHSA